MSLQQIKRATFPLILSGAETPQSGTGYLVRSDRLVTCHHVVATADGEAEGNDVDVFFPSGTVTGTVLGSDPGTDCALIGLDEPVKGIDPIQLAGAVPGEGEFLLFGFPGVAKGAAFPIRGRIVDPAAAKSNGGSFILLDSDVFRAPVAPAAGLSGSPVTVDGCLIGHLCSGLAFPSTSGRLAFGYAYAAPVAAIRAILDFEPEAFQPPEVPLDVEVAAEIGPAGLYARWQELCQDGGGDPETAHFIAERLIAQGEAKRALEVLPDSPELVRGRQLLGLALTRVGRDPEALEVLLTLKAEHDQILAPLFQETGVELDDEIPADVDAALASEAHRALLERAPAQARDYAETCGILGGIRKRMYEATKDVGYLRQARALYWTAYRLTRNPYVGINAAMLALVTTHQAEHQAHWGPTVSAIAASVLEELKKRPERYYDHWDYATLGEAYLLSIQPGKARSAYAAAVRLAGNRFTDRAVMRRQVRTIHRLRGAKEDAMDPIFDVPRIAAFTGHLVDREDRPEPRFPESSVVAARQKIREVLEKYRVRLGFSQAADGGDLLFVDALRDRGGRARIVLPFSAERFRETSVLPAWGDKFDQCLAKTDPLDLAVLSDTWPPSAAGQDEAFRTCNVEILERAKEEGRVLDETPLLIALWDGGESVVKEMILAAKRDGFEVVTIETEGLSLEADSG